MHSDQATQPQLPQPLAKTDAHGLQFLGSDKKGEPVTAEDRRTHKQGLQELDAKAGGDDVAGWLSVHRGGSV